MLQYPVNILNSGHNNRRIRVERKINLTIISVEMKVHIMSSYNLSKRGRIQKI